jgi:hypothetical protein
MSEVDQLDDAGHTPETIQRLERAMEKYAPAGYDPASDDLTIPFAMELVEKDRKIESDAKVIAALREDEAFLKLLFEIAADSRYSSELIGIRVRNELTQRTAVIEQTTAAEDKYYPDTVDRH